MNIIEKARRKKRLSQQKLAKKCDVRQSCISQIESLEEFPAFKLLKKLAVELQICPIEIFRQFLCKECPHKNCPCRIK